ncbi:MAG: hypothetical protein BRC31_00285, partial [Actinobacteria bacterium QS_5_72_10]
MRVGPVPVGGGAPVSVQSMTTTHTHDVNATLQQIAALQAAGADIVRVACPRQEDVDALEPIAAKSQVPIVADIHFQWKYAMAAIEAGVAGIRLNPGNIHRNGDHSKVAVIGDAAKAAGVPIRIGVNGGSLEKWLLEKHGGRTGSWYRGEGDHPETEGSVPGPDTAAVVTVSTRAAEGAAADEVGPDLSTRLGERGWRVISQDLVGDDRAAISEAIRAAT